MARYLIGRIAQFVIVIGGALLITFLALHLVADPAILGLPVGTPQEAVDAFNEKHGFNDDLLTQFGRFLGDAVRGDFGDSLWLGGDALGHVFDRLPATLMLTVPAVLGGGLLGVTLGSISARRPESGLANGLNVFSYSVISIAEFWLAIMLVLVFAVNITWLPTAGYDPKPQVMILPILVLSLRPFAQNFQLTQATMSAEYGKPYVLAARAKGLSEGQVARRHVLRNVAVPVVTLLLFELGRVFVGTAIIVEIVFAWPGIGRLAANALFQGDVFLVQAVVVVAALATASLNLLADLFYFAIDPRTRHLVGVKER
ncbi:MAG: ABC transporter permease [Actinomycetota bacterium]|nr:ABC transporter permease [Actinomycetota bacterium]